MTIHCYTTFKNRFLGLMFKKKAIDYGLCFPKCNSIHTFFMMQSIDVVMTDSNHKILYMFPNFKPWKLILPKSKVYYTYELPLGSSKYLQTNDIFNNHINKGDC